MSARMRFVGLSVLVAAAASGCDSDGMKDPGPGESVFERPFCDGSRWAPLSDIRAISRFDHLGEYVQHSPDLPPELVAEVGKPCDNATNRAECLARTRETADLPRGSACGALPCLRYLLAPSADDVRILSKPDALRQFFGDIDTPQEAAMLAEFSGYTLYGSNGRGYVCGEPENSAIRAVQDGFELIATKLTKACLPVEFSRVHLHVARDGRIEVSSTEVIQTVEGCI
jgi:hypothetical protein